MKKQIRYVKLGIVERIHERLREYFASEEPIDPFSDNVFDIGKLEGALQAPQMNVYGQELYPTLEEKGAVLFYLIIKNHLFRNGNKRMAVMCLDFFLYANDIVLTVSRAEFFNKALETVNSDPKEFDQVKKSLAEWIRANIK